MTNNNLLQFSKTCYFSANFHPYSNSLRDILYYLKLGIVTCWNKLGRELNLWEVCFLGHPNIQVRGQVPPFKAWLQQPPCTCMIRLSVAEQSVAQQTDKLTSVNLCICQFFDHVISELEASSVRMWLCVMCRYGVWWDKELRQLISRWWSDAVVRWFIAVSASSAASTSVCRQQWWHWYRVNDSGPAGAWRTREEPSWCEVLLWCGRTRQWDYVYSERGPHGLTGTLDSRNMALAGQSTKRDIMPVTRELLEVLKNIPKF